MDSSPGIEVVDGRVFCLHTATSTYAFGLDEHGLLRHLHWGGRVAAEQFEVAPSWDLSTNDLVAGIACEEYPVHGGFRYGEQSLAVRLADGTRDVRPRPVSHDVVGDTLAVRLVDDRAGVEVVLNYRVVTDSDLIERWAAITNMSGTPIAVTRAASAQFHIPHRDLTLRNVQGYWGAEQQEFVQPVGPAKLVLESRRGISSHHHNPYVILDRGAGPDSGQVWFAALRFGGNFACVVEQPPYGGTRAQIGINDYDFEVVLDHGQSLTTPQVVAGYTAAGLDDVAARLHRYGRALMADGPRPVLYNSWEATGFDVTESGQRELARRAADIGVELFVVDDGWFGRRSSQRDGLGDWWVDPQKFPDGLRPLIEAVHSLGMRFGLWVEPEMVNTASDLYRAHPEWVYRDLRGEPDTARDQLVLNLCLPEVQEFVYATVNGLLTDNEIGYLKWDANRPMSQVGPRQDVWLRHTEALYAVVRRLKQQHPDVLIEACASGGGRIDFGTLSVFDDFWTSDNTDALDRLHMQRSFAQVYPPKAMRAWVTDSPNFLTQRAIPLAFRFHVAMLGSLGVGSNLLALTDDEAEQYAGFVEQYKRLRDVIQEGEVRLHSADGYEAFEYVHAGRAALFVFLPSIRIGRPTFRVRLRGLEAGATYRFTHDWRTQVKFGSYLMEHGLTFWMFGDYQSTVVEFEQVR